MHGFWGMKKLVELKFVQLLLLNRVKGKMIEKSCCSRFLLHKFVQLKYFWTQLKYFWTQFKNVHLQGPCSLRPCISRPYCSLSTRVRKLFKGGNYSREETIPGNMVTIKIGHKNHNHHNDNTYRNVNKTLQKLAYLKDRNTLFRFQTHKHLHSFPGSTACTKAVR